MRVLDICKARRSVRSFTGDPLSGEDLTYLMEAARWAATSSNRQARRFVVLRDADRIARVVEEADMQDFVADCGALIFGISTDGDRRGAVADVLISLTQLEMAAVERGLGTLWLGMWNRDAIIALLDIPEEMEPVMAIAIGEAADEGGPREKLPIDELFKEDHV